MTDGQPEPLLRPPAGRRASLFLRVRKPPPRLRAEPSGEGRPVLVRIGSRGSRLAMAQAEQAAARLRRRGVEVAFVPITTAGDRDRKRPFGEIGARGVFVKEIEEALLAGRIDVAVHSAKDMTSTGHRRASSSVPTSSATTRATRSSARHIRPGMRIGTASARRKAQLLALEPSLQIEPMRGNVETRLRKRASEASTRSSSRRAASTGSGSSTRSARGSTPTRCFRRRRRAPLALQVRAGEEQLVAAPTIAETRRRVEPERACVAAIGAGCLAPVAAHHDGTRLRALIAAEDGSLDRERQRRRPGRARPAAGRGSAATHDEIGTEPAQTRA